MTISAAKIRSTSRKTGKGPSISVPPTPGVDELKAAATRVLHSFWSPSISFRLEVEAEARANLELIRAMDDLAYVVDRMNSV